MFEPYSLIRTEGTLEPGLYWFLRTYMRSKKRGVNGTRNGIRPAERVTPVLGARGPPAASGRCSMKCLAPRGLCNIAELRTTCAHRLNLTFGSVESGWVTRAERRRQCCGLRVVEDPACHEITQSSLKERLYIVLSTVFSIFFQSDRRWMNS